MVQPSNRGTATAVLTGLFHVLDRQHGPGRVLFRPSDHSVADEDRLQAALEAAIDEADEGRLVLVGMPASQIESGYGWIVPSPRGNGGAHPRVTGDLAVLQADDCGWADLGTPDRLERHLAELRPPVPLALH